MHYTLVLLLVAVAWVAFGPASALLVVSKGTVLFMLLAGVVNGTAMLTSRQ